MEYTTTSKMIVEAGSLYEYFETITDLRKKRGIRYSLPFLLLLIVLAKICREDKPYGIADWVKQREEMLRSVLQIKHPRMPHHTTYARILDLCAEEIEQAVSRFMMQLPGVQDSQIISLDGKTARGTITREDRFGLHVLSVYLPAAGITLKQLPVEKEKENEIVVAPKALENLDLKGKIVVGDAMQTQKALSTQIVKAGGDYVWIVKGNQSKIQTAIEQLFASQTAKPGFGIPPTDFAVTQTVKKHHGRLEERTLTASNMLNDYLDWPDVQQVFKLERHFVYSASGSVHHEIQYGLTSLSAHRATPRQLLDAVRAEWEIENGLHYRRDVTFHEDATRTVSLLRAVSISKGW